MSVTVHGVSMEVNIDNQFDWMKNHSRDVSERNYEGFSGQGELWHSHDFQP